VKAPVAMVVPYNWTGFYIGANLGAEEGWSRWTFNGVPTNGNVRPAGVMAGGQVGYDQQIGQWVLGVEGMVDWSNSHGARGCPQNPFIDNCESKLDFLATLTGRVGYAFWNRAIVYVKGGVAVGDLRERVICNTDSRVILGIGVPPGCPAVGESQTKAGYTVGFGSEFALAQNWTVKGETSFFDLGKVNFNGFPVAPPASIRTDGFTATVALNYRFH
jgi:opacity protein-like surface antigen